MVAGADGGSRRKYLLAVVALAREQGHTLRPTRGTPSALKSLAGSLHLGVAIAAIHSRQFGTMLGPIGVDAKGDVTGFERVRMVRGRPPYVPNEIAD